MQHSTWVEISKQALVNNIKQFRKIYGKASLLAVVKSNAYGHGYGLVSRAIETQVDYFGTANLDEALELRKNKVSKPILVLNYYGLDLVEEAIKQNISLVVYDWVQIKTIANAAKRLRMQARVHVKIDTGTSRLGVMPREALKFVTDLAQYKNIEIEGIFSHFAASEDNAGYTQMQFDKFSLLLKQIKDAGINIEYQHIACTASSLAFPQTRSNLVRLGIGTYGLWSYKSVASTLKKYKGFRLAPALSWKTRVVSVRTVPANTYIGYGLTYKTTRTTKLAVLPVGYYEGYDRRFSNNSEVLIGGKRCKVLGRVFMNLLIADATNVKKIKTGDEAVLIGRQGKLEITAESLAAKINTINYEVVARINPLIPRILK